MRSTNTLTLIIMTILVVGTQSTSAIAASSRDACLLLTQAQVSAELGVQVQAGEHIVETATTLCGWAPPGGPKINGPKVVLDLKTTQAFDIGKTPIKGVTKTPVSGVGDGAYYITAGGLGTSLSVRKGDVAFNIAVHGNFSIDQIEAKEKALALQVLSKL